MNTFVKLAVALAGAVLAGCVDPPLYVFRVMPEGTGPIVFASNENEFVWSYLANSDLKASLQYPNGLTASWSYDANNQLLRVRNAMPTNVISQFDYTEN